MTTQTKIIRVEFFPNSNSVSITKVEETTINGTVFKSQPLTKAFVKFNIDPETDELSANVNYAADIDAFTGVTGFLETLANVE